jgi:hypothetical protein
MTLTVTTGTVLAGLWIESLIAEGATAPSTWRGTRDAARLREGHRQRLASLAR